MSDKTGSMYTNIVWVEVSQLQIDRRYQRDFRPSVVNRIAKDWDFAAAGVLSVSQREDMSMWIIDGQHRYLGALKRGVKLLRCEIHHNLTIEQEAQLWLVLNKNRNAPNESQSHNAQKTAGDSKAQLIESLIRQSGRTQSAKVSSAHTVACVGAMRWALEKCEDALPRIWPLITELCEGEIIVNRFVRGMTYAEYMLADGRSLTEPVLRRKLLNLGYAQVTDFLNRAQVAYAAGGERTWAEGIINAVNYRVKEESRVRLLTSNEIKELKKNTKAQP